MNSLFLFLILLQGFLFLLAPSYQVTQLKASKLIGTWERRIGTSTASISANQFYESSSSQSRGFGSTTQSQPKQLFQLPSLSLLSKWLSVKINKKTLNLWGVFFGFIVFTVTAVLLPAISLTALFCDLSGHREQRKSVDWWINRWSWFSLRLTGSQVLLFGQENLPPDPNEPVIYVPNHTSFLDIFALSGTVFRPFKYFSKSEILKIPLVGWGMQLAQHVFLNRKDPKSAIQSVDACISRLKEGNSMVVFAEGTRSPDGRLGPFKNGAFRIAEKTGARIVPVSIGNLFRIMPPTALAPLRRISNAYVMIHPPIDSKGKSAKELKHLCFQAINSGLPPYQQSDSSTT